MDIAKLDWTIDFRGRAQHIPAKTGSATHRKAHYFINPEGHRCFFIEMTDTEASSLIRLSSLKYKHLENRGRLEVVCPNHTFHESFDILFMETFELMNERKLPFSDAYHEILSKYHAFLQGEMLLTPAKQIGLLNELFFLRLILQKDKKALKYWIDQSEDFQFGNVLVELKATRSRVHKHTINGLAQLSVPDGTRKYLVSSLSIELNEIPTLDSVNLYDITEEIQRSIAENEKRDLLNRLIERGYFHELNGVEYKSFNFHIYEMKYIEVDSAFPCINLSSLDKQLYSYIDPYKVRYDLDLSGLSDKLQTVDEDFISLLTNG